MSSTRQTEARSGQNAVARRRRFADRRVANHGNQRRRSPLERSRWGRCGAHGHGSDQDSRATSGHPLTGRVGAGEACCTLTPRQSPPLYAHSLPQPPRALQGVFRVSRAAFRSPARWSSPNLDEPSGPATLEGSAFGPARAMRGWRMGRGVRSPLPRGGEGWVRGKSDGMSSLRPSPRSSPWKGEGFAQTLPAAPEGHDG